jgi:peptide/nickel transport system substrate-binding protein
MTRSSLKHALAGLAVVASAGAAWADKANDTLRAAFTKELENVDSYFNSSREGVVLQRAVWDGLIYRDPVTNEYKGNLATSWEWIDDTTLEFELREGVTFHNGEAFNADDVVYTVNFVSKEENGVKTQRNVNWMDSAEKIDDYTVRIHLKEKFPAAIEFLIGSGVDVSKRILCRGGSVGDGSRTRGDRPLQGGVGHAGPAFRP